MEIRRQILIIKQYVVLNRAAIRYKGRRTANAGRALSTTTETYYTREHNMRTNKLSFRKSAFFDASNRQISTSTCL